MKLKLTILLVVVLFVTTGCYGTLRGKVVDAETGEPIEGAVAMAEWTKTKGLGLTYTVSAKVVETVSDKDGNIEIEGCYSPFVNKPDLTIYKRGYVAWNNRYIFPDFKKRLGFKWKNFVSLNMVKFQSLYSHDDHVSFISSSINSTIGYSHKKDFIELFAWEEEIAQEERRAD